MATEKNKSNKANSKRKTNLTKGKRKSAESKKVHNQLKEDPNKELFRDEITLILALVVSLLLILSNFNLSGNVGEAINGFTFGVFGFIAYLLPFFLFFGMAFYIANRGNRIAMRKLISTISLGIIFTALIQLITIGYTAETKIIQYYTVSADLKSGGGIIGGLLCKLLHPLFGTIGTYIILIAFMVVFFMFITGKALFAYLGSRSEASIRQRKERKMLQEKEYLSQDGMEAETVQRRKARTVLLKKNGTEAGGEVDTDAALNKGIETGFLNLIKKKKNKNVQGKTVSKVIPDFDMEEIISQPAKDFPIQRGDGYYDGTTTGDKNKTYEEQLKMKFGRNPEASGTPANINAERSGIDDDIQRLLRAAEQNQDTQDTGNMAYDIHKTEFTASGISQSPGISEAAGAGKEPAGRPAADRTLPATGSNISDREDIKISQKLEEKKEYVFPPINLLSKPKTDIKGMSDRDLKETALKLRKTLESFGVRVTITNISCGPAVTRYELQPEQGVKVSKITGLADDIKLNLAAADVRIEAPIPGKAAVGIEVPNKENSTVMFRELIESKDFKHHPSHIAFAVGKDIGGQTIVTDIGKMPHLLIAGATGSGKSVCINTLIMSILYKAKPSDVRMIMVDPKVVELSVYNGIPHLLIPVVTDPKKASAALNWAVVEMTERYKKFADLGVRDVKGYNEKIAAVAEHKDERYEKLPQIVIIVDELADLMMVAPGEVEDAICRLAQMARAAGLHLIIATQRPSVNVITGLIKANIPSRIAFSVSSAIDSRTIIDGSGAEKLLGKGDMLFFPSGYPKPVRVQGAFISDKEVGAVVNFLTSRNSAAEYNEEVANKITNAQAVESSPGSGANERDDYFIEAGKFIIDKDKASIGMLQRVYKIGFNRAARIMDQLAEAGVVGPEEGTKPRKILMSMEEFEQYADEYV